MKKKRNYSLTAKERKELRRAEENKNRSSDRESAVSSGRENSERVMLDSQQRSKRRAMLIGGVVCLSILLIIIALVAPAVMFIVNPYRGYNYVIARFNLSNGMRLEYVIDEDDYDTAATNFIFLAKNGFFDNTVFYDAQNGWLRFGGYEAQPTTVYNSSDYNRTHHRKDNEKYYKNFSAIPNSRMGKEDNIKNKFGYRLYADGKGTDARELEKEGVLAYLYNDTATEFQFAYKAQATNQINSLSSNGTQTTSDLLPTMVGHAFNDKTLENLRAIAALAQRNMGMTTGYQWTPPTPDIMIKSVKVYNLDGKKWRNFDFIDYMSTPDGSGHQKRFSQWYGVV